MALIRPPVPEADHAVAARDGCAAAVFKGHGIVLATGSDARAFLHRVSSAPVADAPAGTVVRALVLDVKGRARCAFRVLVGDDRVVLDELPGMPDGLCASLDRYLFADDVTLEDRGERPVVGLFGAGAPAIAASVAALGNDAPSPGRWVEAPAAGGPVFLAGTDVTGAPGAWMACTDDDHARAVLEAAAGAGATVLPEPTGDVPPVPWPAAVEVERIRAGVPLPGRDWRDDRLPLECGGMDWLSIEKGCYPGQEVIVRVCHQGGVRRRATVLELDGLPAGASPAPGTELLAGDDMAGTVTSSAVDAEGRARALAAVRTEHADGARLGLADADGATAVVRPAAGATPAPVQ